MEDWIKVVYLCHLKHGWAFSSFKEIIEEDAYSPPWAAINQLIRGMPDTMINNFNTTNTTVANKIAKYVVR